MDDGQQIYAAIDWDRRVVIGYYTDGHAAAMALSAYLMEQSLANVSVVQGDVDV